MMKNENRSKQTLKDIEVISLAKSCKTGGRFKALFNEGKVPEDLMEISDIHERIKKTIGRLVFYISFYTQDVTQIKRILRQSALCSDNKYTEDFLQGVVNTVVDSTKDAQHYKKAVNGTNNHYYIQGKNDKVYLNKEKFIEFIKEEYKIINCDEKYYIYKGNHYIPQTENDLKRIMKQYLVDQDISINNFKEILASLSFQTEVKQQEIFTYDSEREKEKVYIPVKNGIYFPINNQMVKSDSSFISSIYYDYSIKDTYNCPLWTQFLNEALPADSIKLLQQYMGYLIFPYNRAQKSLVMIGVPRSGKSTILNIIESLIGAKNVSALTIEDMGEKFGKEGLLGKAVNISSEYCSKISDKTMKLMKQLVSVDNVYTDIKNTKGISKKIHTKFIFASNKCFEFKEYDAAMMRRLTFIEFKKPIPLEKVDVEFALRLEKELEDIFNWAIEGLKELIDKDFHFFETEDGKKIIESYAIAENKKNIVKKECEGDYTIPDFLNNECILSSKEYVELTEIYNKYAEYCEDIGEYAKDKKFFKKTLIETYNLRESKAPQNRRTTIVGIKFIE